MENISTESRLADLDNSLATDPEWFWKWVEWNQADESLLPAWFRRASTEQLKVFWRVYFNEVLGALIPDYEGFCIEEDGGFLLSEDDMSDFNNWVILQGREVWQKMKTLAEERANNGSDFDESSLRGLFEIYHNTRSTEGILPMQDWLGIKWVPKTGFFPGDMADFIYEERFGLTLWEQMD